MSRIIFRNVVEQAGLPELAQISEHELATDFMQAAVVGMADGDIVMLHAPYDAKQAELYGSEEYGTGSVARLMGKAAIENGLKPGDFYAFQEFAAEHFANQQGPFRSSKSQSTVSIFPEAVTIDGNPLILAAAPSLVLDYGACLTSRSYISDQMRFLDAQVKPYVYTPLARSHFMLQALLETYNVNYGPGADKLVMDKRLFIGREDGVAAGTDNIIQAQRKHGQPVDIADVILATGVQHSTTEDMRAGITNAHTLLKAGGMLVIRSLAKPAVGELGTDEMVEWAYDAGFEERTALQYQASRIEPGNTGSVGHLTKREVKTVVLSK